MKTYLLTAIAFVVLNTLQAQHFNLGLKGA